MKKFTFLLILFSIAFFSNFSTSAQTKVKENSVSRQAENTAPIKNWVIYTRNAGVANFVQGPGNPPSGCSSIVFNTPNSIDKAFIYNFDQVGTLLSSITALSYATYQSTGISYQVTGLNLEVDFDGPGSAGKSVLVFEPVYNTNQGNIIANTWQTWDALNGGNAIWWSPQGIPGSCSGYCYVQWKDIVKNNPDAVIIGGFGINQGSGNQGLISAADNLTIGKNNVNKVYNFVSDNCGNSNVTTTAQTPTGSPTYNTLIAYPNPTSGDVNVQMPVLRAAKADIIITDYNGTTVESRSSKTEGQIEKFDLSGKGSGIFTIKLISPSAVEHYKVFVQ